ncbi:PREDICTED: methyl-CpG-binding domain-containing protein 7-like [Ipomoea nil]|uniref:methyl-CpG-binding domain-containing protein 7-like n=1 Tax=Ipomoea nil TaxID=35883 RepID=UPI0009014A47|nr:PREDICTED: methyl-CpG-binding domain-containing protein 7-like [Ipomoea nil]
MVKSKSSSFTSSNSSRPLFSLPEGWGVEEIPRSYGSKFDKYYLEPETGKRFRSLREVERHLNGETVTSKQQKSPQLIASNSLEIIEEWFERPPSKVNWALASAKGDAWNPMVGDTLISDAVKQQWRKRFVSAMNDNESSAAVIPTEPPPQLTEPSPQIPENIQQTQSGEDGRQDEGGLRRSSRTKKLAYHHQDFIYL